MSNVSTQSHVKMFVYEKKNKRDPQWLRAEYMTNVPCHPGVGLFPVTPIPLKPSSPSSYYH